MRTSKPGCFRALPCNVKWLPAAVSARHLSHDRDPEMDFEGSIEHEPHRVGEPTTPSIRSLRDRGVACCAPDPNGRVGTGRVGTPTTEHPCALKCGTDMKPRNSAGHSGEMPRLVIIIRRSPAGFWRPALVAVLPEPKCSELPQEVSHAFHSSA